MVQQYSPYRMPYHDRIDRVVRRGIHLAKRVALSFGLAALSAIAIGAAATDNGLVQILVTSFATLALWGPILFVILWGERTLRVRRSSANTPANPEIAGASDDHWRRLARMAPSQHERIAGLQGSIERSRKRLANAQLDPEAHDLCVLINRRLPDLIDRELDALPPDDRGRRGRIDGLINLVDQFARHCSRHGSQSSVDHDREAEILRRRFEERLAASPFETQ
jgi:hypothetical protein